MLASLCYFQRGLELDIVQRISNCNGKSPPLVFANFFKKTKLFLWALFIRKEQGGDGDLVPFRT